MTNEEFEAFEEAVKGHTTDLVVIQCDNEDEGWEVQTIKTGAFTALYCTKADATLYATAPLLLEEVRRLRAVLAMIATHQGHDGNLRGIASEGLT
jgi:hypothetical protein